MPSQTVRWPIPGKLLIIDNEYDDYIKNAIRQLHYSGASVAYWNGESRRRLINVRVVLLDIDFGGGVADSAEEQDFYDAVDILSKIPGTPLVFVLSSSFKKKYIRLLESVYLKRIGKKFHGIIAKSGMRKDRLTAESLVRKIKNALKPYDMLEILLEWERVVDDATDDTVETLFKTESTGVLKQLIKDIYREAGPNSLGREFAALCARILTRFTKKDDSLEALSNRLTLVASDPTRIPPNAEQILTSMLMHYNPKGEGHLTGDIYKTYEKGPREFAIVLNPMCDFAQRNVKHLIVCYGFSVSKENLGRLTHPLYQADSEFGEILSGLRDKSNYAGKSRKELRSLRRSDAVSYATNKYLGKGKISGRFHILRHVRLRDSKRLQIIFDFQNLASREELFTQDCKLDPWKRFSRLDAPYVDAMLRDFGTYVSRMGVLAVNTPDG